MERMRSYASEAVSIVLIQKMGKKGQCLQCFFIDLGEKPFEVERILVLEY